MSRQIDPYRLDPDDLEYLKQRPLLVQEFVMQGFESPLIVEMVEGPNGKQISSLVVNPAYPHLVDEEGNKISPDESEDEPDEPEDGGDNEPTPWALTDLPEAQQWSEDDNKAELEKVVGQRNSFREDPDTHIVVGGTGKKADIVDALSKDDEYLLDVMNADNGNED